MKSKFIIFFVIAIAAVAGGFIYLSRHLPTRTLLVGPTSPTTSAEPKPSCPEGYVFVPGRESYQTADFCVMKYDAKCDNPDPKCVTNEGVYKNNAPGCACEGSYKVVSTSGGAPITFIPESESVGPSAKSYCTAAGTHLLTNAEWMTIAKNVAQVSANWCNKNGTNCGNAPGASGKILANGHNDLYPYRALPAAPDDEPCFGTTEGGSNICGSKSSQKRTLTLNNGNVIWDLAGNVWQWIDATVSRKDEPRSLTPGLGNLRWTWAEFQTVPSSPVYSPSDPSWSSDQGVGRIYHYNSLGDTDTTIYTYIRGGNWRHGYDSGAFTIHMQPVPDKAGIDDVGFRCAM